MTIPASVFYKADSGGGTGIVMAGYDPPLSARTACVQLAGWLHSTCIEASRLRHNGWEYRSVNRACSGCLAVCRA